jgi:DNA-directed RNA polymerase specialized sigma subunit
MVHRQLERFHNNIAHEVVRKFKTADVPYEDMYQEALIGIWQSLERANAKGEYPSTLYMKLRGQDRVKRLVNKELRVSKNETSLEGMLERRVQGLEMD